jgi:hypothetical protein
MEKYGESTEKMKKDGQDRGEIRTVFSTSSATIKASGLRMCERHQWRKLNDTEVACSVCPTVNIVENTDKYIEEYGE